MVVAQQGGIELKPILNEHIAPILLLKFIYSKKPTKFCEIFLLLFTVCTVVKSKGKISQNCAAFSEYMNFTMTCFLIRRDNIKLICIDNIIVQSVLLLDIRKYIGS